MRNRDVIEREIDRARVDLQASIGELKHVVQDKLDIRANVVRAIEHKKDDAKIAMIHGKNYVRARPDLFAAILAGALAATAAFVIYQRSHRSLF